MNKKKNKEVLEATVEEGMYECPNCGETVYLDVYDISKLIDKGHILHRCTSCNVNIKLTYEQDNYSEL